MNLTLSVDERVAGGARKAAQAMGKSLNQVVRDYLEQLAGQAQLDAGLEELRSMAGQGDSGGARFSREATTPNGWIVIVARSFIDTHSLYADDRLDPRKQRLAIDLLVEPRRRREAVPQTGRRLAGVRTVNLFA
jgi:hypothetical protein